MNSVSLNRWHHWLLESTGKVFFVIFFFFCTVNRLTSVPIDKILICFCPILLAIINPNKALFTAREFLLAILFTAVAMLSSVMNFIIFPMIFFPIIGYCFAVIVSRNFSLLLSSLYYALLIHIVLGIILVLLAFFGIADLYVSAGVKGFDLYSAHGLTATTQTFGTLCITWLLLYIFRKKLGLNTSIDKIFFLINLLAIALTFNRSTYLFWIVILFFEFPVFFWSIIILMTAVVIKFWSIISLFIFSSASITARSELLEGFKISYVHSNSARVYLFGRGTDQISEAIAKRVKWTTRTDLENGYAMLLHTYGIVGLLTYVTVCLCFIFMFLQRKRFKEASYLFFYFFVTQYITQEFVSTTFYLLLAVMMLIYTYYNDPAKFKSLKD